MFIYNGTGVINSDSIADLHLTTKLSKNIAVSDDNIDQKMLSNFFPKFLWILRDFVLELVDEKNNSISPVQYMENALNEQVLFFFLN